MRKIKSTFNHYVNKVEISICTFESSSVCPSEEEEKRLCRVLLKDWRGPLAGVKRNSERAKGRTYLTALIYSNTCQIQTLILMLLLLDTLPQLDVNEHKQQYYISISCFGQFPFYNISLPGAGRFVVGSGCLGEGKGPFLSSSIGTL